MKKVFNYCWKFTLLMALMTIFVVSTIKLHASEVVDNEVIDSTDTTEVVDTPSSDAIEETQASKFINEVMGLVISGVSGVTGATAIVGAALVWLRKRANKLQETNDSLSSSQISMLQNLVKFCDVAEKNQQILEDKVKAFESMLLDNQSKIADSLESFIQENKESFEKIANALAFLTTEVQHQQEIVTIATTNDVEKVKRGIANAIVGVNEKYEENKVR